MRRIAFILLPFLAVGACALTCEDLDLLCSGGHPIEFSYTLNQSAIPSFDGSAYIWAKTGTVITSKTSTVHCQEYTTYLLVTSSGIPNHNVGKFPFTQSTVGRQHGDNPNTIAAQNYQWKIPKTPVKKATVPAQNIMQNTKAMPMGPIGFALNGVPFFNPYNKNDQDAMNPTSGGFEVMDLCYGHPQMVGAYHYHHQAPKAGCLFTDTPGKHSPKIGYAFDGIPVYGPLSDNGVKPTDLDICNGRTHPTKGYIYHITELKPPYIIGCYRYQVTDMVPHGTISTAGGTQVQAQSTSCSAKIGQTATKSTATTRSTVASNKPSTVGPTSKGMPPPPSSTSRQHPPHSRPQPTGTGSRRHPPTTPVYTGTGSGPYRTLPSHHGTGARTGTRTRTGTRPIRTRPGPSTPAFTGTGSRPYRTRPGRTTPAFTGTGSRPYRTRPGHTTPAHTGTGSMPNMGTGSRHHHGTPTGAPATHKVTGNGVSGGNQAVTTPIGAAAKSKSPTILIVGIVAGVAVAVTAIIAIIFTKRRASATTSRATELVSTYKQLEAGK